MSRANPYIPGLRAVVGNGLPGRPVRDVGGSVFKVGDIHTSVAALPGEWIAADGGPWDERLSDALTPGYKNMVRSPELSPALTATPGRALDMSADARLLATSVGSSLYLYKRNLNDFVRVATVAKAAVHCKFSPDGKYLAAATSSGSFLYAVVDDALVEIALPGKSTVSRHSCSWSPSGQYLVVTTGGSGRPELIKRTGNTFEVCPDTFMIGSNVFAAWSLDSSICYVSETGRTSIYLRSGDTFTKQGETSAVSGSVTSVVSSPSSNLLLVGCSASPYLYAYRITGTTLTGLPIPAGANLAPVSGIAFSSDGRAMFLGSDTVSLNPPRVYSVSGETMTPMVPPYEDTSVLNNHLTMASASRFLAASCGTAPYLKMYTSPIPAVQGAGEGVSRIKVG